MSIYHGFESNDGIILIQNDKNYWAVAVLNTEYNKAIDMEAERVFTLNEDSLPESGMLEKLQDACLTIHIWV